MTLEELQIKFSAETSGLNSELQGVKKAVGGLEQPAGKASGALGGLAKMGGMIAAAGIGAKLVGVGKDALMMANEVTESESLFEVSMGAMADDARAWSDELSKSLGVNAYSARKNVGVLNTMFKSMGLGQGEAASMAKDLTMLSEDMASFYNLDPTEAFTKLQAGITGEAEGLKRLGILVDEGTVQQYALRKGIIKQGQAMTNQQKVAARYGAILEQTTDAQGDLARTMDSPTNQMRKLNNEFDQAKIALGQALQPALVAVMPALTGVAQGIASLFQGLSNKGDASGLTTAFDDITVSVQQASADIAEAVDMGFVTAMDKIRTAEAETAAALDEYVADGKKIKKVAIEIALDPPTTTGRERITEAIDGLETEIGEYKSEIKKTVMTRLNAQLKAGKITQTQYDAAVEGLDLQLADLEKKRDDFAAQVKKKLDVILEDGVITKREGTSFENWLSQGAKTMINQINRDTLRQTRAIDVAVKSGAITEEEGTSMKAAIEAEAAALIGTVNATVASVSVQFAAGEAALTMISFDPTQTENLISAVEASIDSSIKVVDAAVEQVQVTFANTGVIGVAMETLYSGLAEKVKAKNEELEAIVGSWSDALKPPTQEDWNKVLAIAAERDAMMAILSGGLTEGGKLTGALFDLTLNAESIGSYFEAFGNAFTEESNAAAALLTKQKNIILSAAELPEFDSIMSSLGFEGMTAEGAISMLEQQIADALSAGKSSAIMDAAERLMPSIAEAIASGDTSALKGAGKSVATFIEGIGADIDNLTPEATAAVLAMVDAFGGNLPGLSRETEKALTELKATALAEMPGLEAVFGKGAKSAMVTLTEALFSGAISKADFDKIVGAAASEEALRELQREFLAGGNEAALVLIREMLAQKGAAEDAGKQLKDAAAGGMSGGGSGAESAGANVGQGFVNGISSKKAAAIAAAAALANSAVWAFEDELVINSPSAVTQRIGEYVGEGFAIGMEDTANMVYGTGSMLAGEAASGLASVQGAFSGGMSANMDMGAGGGAIAQAVQAVMDALNINLVVDGEQFGRVAVRTINETQRRAGQYLLGMG